MLSLSRWIFSSTAIERMLWVGPSAQWGPKINSLMTSRWKSCGRVFSAGTLRGQTCVIQQHTYTSYERKISPLKHNARKVSVEWVPARHRGELFYKWRTEKKVRPKRPRCKVNRATFVVLLRSFFCGLKVLGETGADNSLERVPPNTRLLSFSLAIQLCRSCIVFFSSRPCTVPNV